MTKIKLLCSRRNEYLHGDKVAREINLQYHGTDGQPLDPEKVMNGSLTMTFVGDMGKEIELGQMYYVHIEAGPTESKEEVPVISK